MNKLIKILDKRRWPALLILFSYMLQGVASLIYQVSWEQAMEITVGMALPTVSIVICMFFLGMSLGAYVFARLGQSSELSGKLFITSQIGIALFALIFVLTDGCKFVGFLNTDSEKWIFVIHFLRIVVLSLFLLVPAFFIGATFTLLQKVGPLISLSHKTEKLYLANLLGSSIGAVLIGFIMLPNMGLKECSIFALILNLFSILFFVLAEKIKLPQTNTGFSQAILISSKKINLATEEKEKNFRVLFILVILVAAFFNMFLELLFMRLCVLYLGSSAFAFSLISTMQLIALASGSLFANFIYKLKREHVWSFFAFLYLLSSLWLLADIFCFPHLYALISVIRSCLTNNLACPVFLSFCLSNAVIIFLLMFFPCLCLGANLPFYLQLRNAYPRMAPIKSAYAYALNLFASTAGCFSGGVLIFPILTRFTDYAISLAFVLSATLIFLMAMVIYIFSVCQTTGNKRIYLNVSLGAIFILGFVFGGFSGQPLLNDSANLLFYKEGINSTVSLAVNEKENLIRLQTDGRAEATLPWQESLPTEMSDETTQNLLGLLPNIFSLHSPKSAFLLGFGSGVTAQAILTNREIEKLTVAEFEPAVIMAAQWLKKYSKDQRLNVKIIDGRSLLSMFKHSYDIIVLQPDEPWRSSSKYLYTFEFWQLIKSRLKRDAIFCQWIPLYAVDKNNLSTLCQTFTRVFSNTFVIKTNNAGELILLAYNFANNKIDNNPLIILRMQEMAKEHCKLQEIKTKLVRLGFNNLSDIFSTFRFAPQTFWEYLFAYKEHEKFLCNTDNFPFVQYRLQNLMLKEGMSINVSLDNEISKRRVSDFRESNKDNGDFSTVAERLVQAKEAIAKHDLERASICLDDVIEQQPNNFEARFILGRIFCYLNKEQAGLWQIKLASKINPDNTDPNLFVTLFYSFKSDWSMAWQNFLILEKKLFDNSEVHYLEKQIKKECKLDKNDNKIRLLMLKCHYPI